MPEKPKILVIDPDAAARRLIGQALLAIEAEPRVLASGGEAAALVGREKFDGIFLDWSIPDMKAGELVDQIRQSKWNYAAPIIAMAAARDRQAMAESFKAGVTFFLGKPLNTSKVQRLLAVSRGLILEERRQFQRAKVALPIDCQHEQEKRRGTTIDLSARGVLVKIGKPYPVDSALQVRFELPAKREVSAVESSGRVVRVTAKEEMGIRFLRLSREERQQIVDLVEETLEKTGATRKAEAKRK